MVKNQEEGSDGEEDETTDSGSDKEEEVEEEATAAIIYYDGPPLLDRLPNEIMLHIMSYLTVADVYSISLSTSTLNRFESPLILAIH